MKTCSACKFQIGDSFSACPICGMLQENVKPETAFYPKTRTGRKLLFCRNLLTVLLWGSVLVSGIVNIAVGGTPWAVYVFLGAYVAQVVFLSVETAEISLSRRIISGSLAISILLWGVEWITKSGRWATEIVIPLVLFAAILACTVLYFSAFRRYRTQFLPILVLSGGAILAAVLGIYGIIPIRWPLITLSGFALAASLSMLIVFWRTLRIEFKKKMHR